MEIIPRRDGNKEYLKPPTQQPMCNSISLKIATDGSMIFGNQPQWALPCQMLPGFIPLGESLRDPKDVLLSNSAEFVQCPDATVSKKKAGNEAGNEGMTPVFPTCFRLARAISKCIRGETICAKSRHETPRYSLRIQVLHPQSCGAINGANGVHQIAMPATGSRSVLVGKVGKRDHFPHRMKGRNELRIQRIQFSITLVSDRSKPMKII